MTITALPLFPEKLFQRVTNVPSYSFYSKCFQEYLLLPLLYSSCAKNKSLVYLRAWKATDKPIMETFEGFPNISLVEPFAGIFTVDLYLGGKKAFWIVFAMSWLNRVQFSVEATGFSFHTYNIKHCSVISCYNRTTKKEHNWTTSNEDRFQSHLPVW